MGIRYQSIGENQGQVVGSTEQSRGEQDATAHQSRVPSAFVNDNFKTIVQFRTPSLRIVWGDVNDKNVKLLERLNSTIFPIKYDETFYRDVIKAPSGFVKLAYYNEILVGAVCCRTESYSPKTTISQTLSKSKIQGEVLQQCPSRLYILTLGVLAPYRERGVGGKLLDHVLDLVETSAHCKSVVEVYLHLQVGNDEALRFYKHHGFEVVDTLVAYYKRLEPADCFVVRKAILRTTFVQHSSAL